MSTVIFEYDVTKHLKVKTESLPMVRLKGLKVQVAINDKVMDAMEASKDRDLGAARILLKAQKVCEATTLAVDKLLEIYQDNYKKATTNKAQVDLAFKCKDDVKKAVEELKKELVKLPEVQWQKFLAKYGKAKQEYKKYKVEAGVNLTVGTLGVAASGAAMAGAVHTGGVSLVLGIVGMVRSGVKVAHILSLIARDVEKLAKELQTDLANLTKELKQSKGKAVVKDLSKTALGALVGAQFFNTAATAGKRAEELEGKVAGTFISAVKYARTVTAMLHDAKWKQLLSDLEHSKNDKAKKIEAKLKTIGKQYAEAFETAAGLNVKVKTVQAHLKEVRKALVVLKNEGSELAIVEKVINSVVEIGLGIASAGVGIHHAGDEILEKAYESVKLVSDLAAEAKEVFDQV